MKRITAMLVVAAILVLALAAPAMAKNLKLAEGEPVLSGNAQNPVVHCGPLLELVGIENVHGAVPLGDKGQGGQCVQAPQP